MKFLLRCIRPGSFILMDLVILSKTVVITVVTIVSLHCENIVLCFMRLHVAILCQFYDLILNLLHKNIQWYYFLQLKANQLMGTLCSGVFEST